jgi:hypothetical protein
MSLTAAAVATMRVRALLCVGIDWSPRATCCVAYWAVARVTSHVHISGVGCLRVFLWTSDVILHLMICTTFWQRHVRLHSGCPLPT